MAKPNAKQKSLTTPAPAAKSAEQPSAKIAQKPTTPLSPKNRQTWHTLFIVAGGILLLGISATGMYFGLRLDEQNKNAVPQTPNRSSSITTTPNEDTTIADVPSRKETNTTAALRQSNSNTKVKTNTNSDTSDDWKTLTDKQYGFSLQYPKNWDPLVAEINAEENTFLLTITPTTNETDDETFIFARQITGFEDVETLNEETITIAGGTAKKITATDPEQPGTKFVIIFFNDSNPKKYQSLFITYAINTPTFTKQYEKIVNSIK